MSSEINKKIKNENIIEKEKINEEREFSIKKSEITKKEVKFQEQDNKEENEVQLTQANFLLDFENQTKLQFTKKDSKNDNKIHNNNIDCSALVLKESQSPENNNIINLRESQNENLNNNNDLNLQNSQNENSSYKNNQNKENKNINQSFMQRTKSWMSNMWAKVKKYNYGKYNIFKRTEMEDCLDAHGNHIRIPKKREDKKMTKKIENEEDFMKYNNLNYNRYSSSTNANVFAGYPF